MNDLIEAWVCADGVDTRYWRAGSGPCVLVLPEPDTPFELVARQVLATLARTHRVLIAEASGTTSAGAWLLGLVEGLGVAPVGLIASTTVEVAVREYLAARSETPACVLWLQSHAPAGLLSASLEIPGSGASNVPLHVGVKRFAGCLGRRTGPPRR